ncbi:MAG: hypothetical protein GC165_11120 [Armatimonadetes bacterium]|nr:hypothetical protein [Armatimonadota bacterium]
MKPVRIVLAIAVAAIIATLVSSAVRNRAYNADGEAINRIIKELKSAGVPTTKSEFDQQYPAYKHDDESRTNLGFAYEGNLLKYQYPSIEAMLFAGGPSDSSAFRDYANGNKATLSQFLIQSKDLSSNASLGQISYFDAYTIMNEFAFSAVVDALERNDKSTLKNFKAAAYIANYYSGYPGSESILSATMWKQLMAFGMKIVEVRPETTMAIASELRGPPFSGRGIVLSAFLTDVTTVRNLDSSLLDKPTFSGWLGRHITGPSDDELRQAGARHTDDFVPQSRAGRSLLRERLESWRSLMLKFGPRSQESAIPERTDLEESMKYGPQVPERLKKLLEDMEGASISYQHFDAYHDLRNLLAVVRAVLIFRVKHGRFPTNLQEASFSKDPPNLIYRQTTKGFQLDSTYFEASNGNVGHQMAFPISDSLMPQALAMYKKQMERFHLRQHSKSGQTRIP